MVSKEIFSAQNLARFFEQVTFVVVTPHGRSGSIFFQNLFDGHPQAYVLPSFYNHFNYLDYSEDIDSAIDLFIKNNPGLFDVARTMFGSVYAASTTEEIEEVDPNRFKEMCLEIAKLVPIEDNFYFAKMIHLAFMMLTQVDDRQINVIILHFHNYELDFYLSDRVLPSSHGHHTSILDGCGHRVKMIALLRHPLESYYSFATLTGDLSVGYFLQINLQTLKCYYYLFENMRRFGKENFFLLDLGSLHRGPDMQLQALCAFLGVEKVSCLDSATVMGRPWHGVSANHPTSNTFDASKAALKYKNFLVDDRYIYYFCLLNELFSEVNQFFLYQADRYRVAIRVKSLLCVWKACVIDRNNRRKALFVFSGQTSRLFKKLEPLLGKKLALGVMKVGYSLFNSSFLFFVRDSFFNMKNFFLLFFYKRKISIELRGL